MKDRNKIKILLDVIMIVVLLLLYNSHVISVGFHEIAGLVLGVLFFVHIFLNFSWVKAISQKIFSKDIKVRVKVVYVIDFLLLISFALIIISGIAISKVVFHNVINFSSARTMHYFASGLSIILIGCHLGLHYGFIGGMFNKMIKVPQNAKKVIKVFAICFVVAFGSYSMVTSQFKTFISAPFVTQQKGGHGQGQFGGKGEKIGNGNQAPPGKEGKFVEGQPPFDRGSAENGNFEKPQMQVRPLNILSIVLTYSSIIGLVSFITFLLDREIRKKAIKPKISLIDKEA